LSNQDESEEEKYESEFKKRIKLVDNTDERTDISKTISGIEVNTLEENEFEAFSVLASLDKILTPVSELAKKINRISSLSEKLTPISELGKKFTSVFQTKVADWYLSTPSTSELDEINKYREEILYLRKQNSGLSQTINKLTTDLTNLTHKYESLQEKSIIAMENLQSEITKLREEIKFFNEIRTLRFSLPESWLEEESNEEE